MTSRNGSMGWDSRKAVSWVPASERESRLSDMGEARRICALRAPRVGWVESWRCKSSQHRKIVSLSLSPHVEKPLNSKRWIKVSYLNQFRECRVFRIPYNQTKHAGHCWRSRDELISDLLLWTPHMTVQKQDDQHEHTFSNYVRIRDVVQKTCLRRWTIGKSGERGSGISMLPARHDDDDIYFTHPYIIGM